MPLDDEITVTYATGKSEVPNFDGLNQAAAIRTASEAGFGEPAFTERESKKLAGTVISQNPKAGDSVDRDTTIKLVLAKAPPSPTPTPAHAERQQPPSDIADAQRIAQLSRSESNRTYVLELCYAGVHVDRDPELALRSG